MDSDRRSRPMPRYLIAVENCVVAEDIASTIAELHPDACILSARTLEDAEDIVKRSGVGIAIVEIGTPDLSTWCADGVLGGCGTRFIYLSDPPNNGEVATARVPATYLQKPFTTDGLVQALRSAEAGPTCGPAGESC